MSTYPTGNPLGPLFNLPPRARATDPQTSHMAASDAIRSGRMAEQHATVLAAVRSQPGRTALEHDRSHGWDRIAGRRLSELERYGLVRKGPVRRCEAGGRPSVTWWAVERDS